MQQPPHDNNASFSLSGMWNSTSCDLACMHERWSNDEMSVLRITWVRWLFAVLFVLFCVISLIANSTVITVLSQQRVLQNITNIFVLTLALSDIVLCVIAIPVQVYYTLSKNLPLSNWSCKLMYAGFGLPMHVSCLTILLIAIDRYRIIISPFRVRMSRGMAIGLLLGTVLLAVLNALPVMMFASVQDTRTLLGENMSLVFHSNGSAAGQRVCMELWPYPAARLVFSVYTYTVQYVGPLLMILLLYLRIYIRLSNRSFKNMDLERKQRTNKILLAIVLCFALGWTPWTTFYLLSEIYMYQHTLGMDAAAAAVAVESNMSPADLFALSSLSTTTASSFSSSPFFPTFSNASASSSLYATTFTREHTELVDLALKLLPVIAGCVNPLLYGWLNDSIRESMYQMYHKLQYGDGSKRESNLMLPAQNDEENAHLPNDREALHANRSRDVSISASMFDASTKRSSFLTSSVYNASPRGSFLTNNSELYGGCGGSSGMQQQQRLCVSGNSLMVPCAVPPPPLPRSSGSSDIDLVNLSGGSKKYSSPPFLSAVDAQNKVNIMIHVEKPSVSDIAEASGGSGENEIAV